MGDAESILVDPAMDYARELPTREIRTQRLWDINTAR